MADCVLARQPCPETADPAKRRYCPAWVDGIPEVLADGSGRLIKASYRGCLLRRLMPYLLSVRAKAGQAGASADKAATEAAKTAQTVVSIGAKTELLDALARAALGGPDAPTPVLIDDGRPRLSLGPAEVGDESDT